MSDDLKLKVAMLERTVLDLGAQLFELKGSYERSREHNEAIQITIFGIKTLLDKEGIVPLENFDEEISLIQEVELSEYEDREILGNQTTNNDSTSSRCRKQKH